MRHRYSGTRGILNAAASGSLRPSPGPSIRRPAHGPASPLLSAVRSASAVHEAADGRTAAPSGGGGWRRGQRCGQHRGFCAVIGGAARRRRQAAGSAGDGLPPMSWTTGMVRRTGRSARSGDGPGKHVVDRSAGNVSGRVPAATVRPRLPCPLTWTGLSEPDPTVRRKGQEEQHLGRGGKAVLGAGVPVLVAAGLYTLGATCHRRDRLRGSCLGAL